MLAWKVRRIRSECACFWLRPDRLDDVAAAKALGASKVIATDVHPLRLSAAAQMGADFCIRADQESVQDGVRECLGEQGVDVAIDYSGQVSALHALIQSVTHGGELRLMGVPSQSVPINLEEWLFKGLIVRGMHGRRLFETWEQSTRLLATGRVDLTSLVSHRLPLTEAQKAFEMALDGQALKILFEPNAQFRKRKLNPTVHLRRYTNEYEWNFASLAREIVQ